MALKLRIVTPARQLVETEASEVSAPGVVGEFGVLPEHATFLGELEVGAVRYVENGERKTVVVYGGYAEVSDDVVTILASDAEFPDEIDRAGARAELERIDEELSRPDLETDQVERLLEERRRAEVRLGEAS
ncbi:MAG: ATP synthase F1 subunit epsilon [Deltaproteobacteria bacterium]|nr:MAG: ATP synthase F1 subunit epsilon [Deltaproteobacteria bacterium]